LENQFSSGWDTEGLRLAGCPRRRCEKWKMGSSSIKGFINIFTNLRLHSLTPPFIGHCLLPLHITTLSPDNYSTFPEYTYDNTSCPGQFGYLLRSTASACWAITASLSAGHSPVPPFLALLWPPEPPPRGVPSLGSPRRRLDCGLHLLRKSLRLWLRSGTFAQSGGSHLLSLHVAHKIR
jgi:hypothetical protein